MELPITFHSASEVAAAGSISAVTGEYQNDLAGIGLPAMDSLEFVTPTKAIESYREGMRGSSFKMTSQEIEQLETRLKSTALTIKPKSSHVFHFFHLRAYSPPVEIGEISDEDLLAAVIESEAAQLLGSVRPGDPGAETYKVSEVETLQFGGKKFKAISSELTLRDSATGQQRIYVAIHGGKIIHLWASYRYKDSIQQSNSKKAIEDIINSLIFK